MSGLKFDGAVVVVTGAGNGLGRAYALWLAERGARVVVNNRVHPDVPSSAQAVVDEIRASGGEAVCEHSSVDDPEAGQRLVDTALESFGRFDALVANAGVSHAASVSAIDLTDFRRVLDVNFWGAVEPALAALRHFESTGHGRIVLTTSAVGCFGAQDRAAYGSAKAGLIGFVRSLATELRKTDIRVNAVSPYARTKMSTSAISDELAELMDPVHVAPVIGGLVHQSCDRSGAVIAAGGGRMRVNVMVEGPAAFVADQPLNERWAELELDGSVSAPVSSGRSALSLIPELRSGSGASR